MLGFSFALLASGTLRLRDESANEKAYTVPFQYPDNLLFAKTLALHSLVLSLGQS